MPETHPFIVTTARSPGRAMSPGNFFGCGGRDTRKLPSRISLRMALFSADGFSNHSTHSVALNCGYSTASTVTFRCVST